MNDAPPEAVPGQRHRTEIPIALGVLHAILHFLGQVTAFLAFLTIVFFSWPPTWFKTAIEEHYQILRYQLCVEHSRSARACEDR